MFSGGCDPCRERCDSATQVFHQYAGEGNILDVDAVANQMGIPRDLVNRNLMGKQICFERFLGMYEETKEMNNAFNDIDTSKDGFICTDELHAYLDTHTEVNRAHAAKLLRILVKY